jgi:hypothetical protein
MLERRKALFVTAIIILMSVIFGYVLRMYHEGKIRAHYQSQAEKEMITLEEEFYSAWKKPRTFFIFNGRFEVYPVKESDKAFYYKQLRDATLDDQDAIISGSMENKKCGE